MKTAREISADAEGQQLQGSFEDEGDGEADLQRGVDAGGRGRGERVGRERLAR